MQSQQEEWSFLNEKKIIFLSFSFHVSLSYFSQLELKKHFAPFLGNHAAANAWMEGRRTPSPNPTKYRAEYNAIGFPVDAK
jgi:hypothetical protein